MKKNLLKSLGIFLFFLAFNFMYAKKPKIVVFTSKCGNAHMSACTVIKDAFPDCQIKLLYPINDYYRNDFYAEKQQEYLVSNGWIRTVNFIVRYPGESFLTIDTGRVKKRLLRLLEQEKPDLLISVVPTINYPAAWAANRCKIPFIIVSLDADLELWLLNMKKCRNNDNTITIQHKTPRIEKQLAKSHIPMSCVHEIGCPLRKKFFEPKDKPAIRKEWNIPEEKKVIMLMRGGTGSNKLVDYVRQLVKLDIPAHLLVCVGRSTALISKLNRINQTKKVTFSIIPFTSKIPDLMSISDLLITQPSPTVCNEAVYSKLPILIDMAGPCLFWEKANVDWLESCGWGQVFRCMRSLNDMVANVLGKTKANYPQSMPCFELEIRKIVMKKLKIKPASNIC